MCNYQTLVYNTSGYIIKCNSCTHLQLAFGTTIVSMDAERFHHTAEQVAQEYMYRNPCADPEMKRTNIPVDEHSMICLNFKELEQLNDMFIQAKALLDTYMILEQC